MTHQENKNTATGLEIAIIGMAGRFPGAKHILQFWDNLVHGRESISFFSHEELENKGMKPRNLKNPNYIKAFGILENSGYFDASFFNYTPGDAEIMDPQVRLLHECIWEALEDAGYIPGNTKLSIGLYIGAAPNLNWEALSYVPRSGRGDGAAHFNESILRNKDFASTWISYNLGLHGPVVSLYTACSTSLVSVDFACRGLLTAQCRIALAGGVSVYCPSPNGYLYEENMIYSPDGHTRTFDKRAGGSVFGEGVGIVVLKTLEEAILHKDHIYAVIKGSATNNDGRRRVGFAAPSVTGQAEVIQAALNMARVSPGSISYIDAHGTATAMGDPIEIEALNMAFNTDKKQYCAIGTVKTNIGHLDAAAGAAGLIKTVLCLRHRMIPPTLHFNTPNPQTDLENSPFYVVSSLTPWKSNGYPLRAGVSSFGIGGTNAHVVLEEWPGNHSSNVWSQDRISREHNLILLSAKTETALENMTKNLVQYLKQYPGINLADAAYTLQVGRSRFQHRRLLVCSSGDEASDWLEKPDTGKVITHSSRQEHPSVVFMFSGLGAQYVNMGRDLYEKVPMFAREMDRCFNILKTLMDYDIKNILYPHDLSGEGSESNTENENSSLENSTTSKRGVVDINRFEVAQIIIFIFEYSLAKLLIQWGIKPHAMIGYSFGEYVSACVSGVFSLEDALKLIVARGLLIQKTPAGAMLSIPLSREELTPLLDSATGLSLAIDNGPSCVVAGTPEAIAAIAKQMKEKKLMCMPVQASHALHSRVMENIRQEYEKIIREIPLNKPQTPCISNVSGDWLTGEQATEPGYWADHLARTVRFADGIGILLKQSTGVFLEIGPGSDICALVKRHIDNHRAEQGHKEPRVLNLIAPGHRKIPGLYLLLNRIGQLWSYGQSIDWTEFYRDQERQRISLPPYPFESKPFTVDATPLKFVGKMALRKSPVHNTARQQDIADWFYIPQWKRSILKSKPGTKTGINSKQEKRNQVRSTDAGLPCWMVFSDDSSLASFIAARLSGDGLPVITVKSGKTFTRKSEREFIINPKKEDDYNHLFKEMARLKKVPGNILHMWNITVTGPGEAGTGPPGIPPVDNDNDNRHEEIKIKEIEKAREKGFNSLIYTARALASSSEVNEVRIEVVSNRLQAVYHEDIIDPSKATMIGPLKVIPQEYPFIICRSIDIDAVLPPKGSPRERELAGHLIREFSEESRDMVIAYRGSDRWVQTYERIHLESPGKASENIPLLKREGVYLVTGGLGNIGSSLAGSLAEDFKARLILTGRTSLPDRAKWEQWLDTHRERNPISRKIRKVMDIENKGSEVLVFGVDVSDPEGMRAVVEQAEKRFGPIDGVIHAAGDLKKSVSPLQQVSETTCQLQFKTKIYGLLTLAKVLENKEPDFCLLTSSLSPILGGLGLSVYASANAFMDAFVHWYNRKNSSPGADRDRGRWISLNWADWQFSRGKKQNQDQNQGQGKGIGASVIEFNITPAEGIETFFRVLYHWECQADQLIVSAGDLQTRLQQWVKLESLRQEHEDKGRDKDKNKEKEEDKDREEDKKHLASPPLHTRPTLLSSYTAPQTPLQKDIADIWQNIFGFEPVGIEDDFFELGGDSLKAITAVSRMHKKLKVQVSLVDFFKNPNIQELANYFNSSEKVETEYISLEPKEKREYYTLSPAQKRLYILQKMTPDSIAYNENAVLSFKSSPEMPQLKEIFIKLIKRQEGLRTSFIMVEGEPVQRVHDYDEITFEIENHEMNLLEKSIEGSPGDPKAPKAASPGKRDIIHRLIEPFDLSRAPLLRVHLVKQATQRFLMLVDLHHIITDGTSNQLLINEFKELIRGRQLPYLRVHYKDYSEWQNLRDVKDMITQQESYWLKQLHGELPVLNLPIDFPRPREQSFAGKSKNFEISAEQTRDLKTLASRQEATLYMLLLTIFNIFLSKLSQQEDIIVGNPVSGRRHPEVENIIGVFVNALPIRNYPAPAKSVVKFLKEVKATALEAFENQDYPFENLVEKLLINRDLARNPIFDVVLLSENLYVPHAGAGNTSGTEKQDLRMRPYQYEKGTSKFDMTFYASETGEKVLLAVEYCTKLFKDETILRIIGYFKQVVSMVVKFPDKRLGEIEIISEKEKQQLLYDFNNTFKTFAGNKALVDLFADQVEINPDRAAVIIPGPGAVGAGSQHLTYNELNMKVGQLALVLKQKGMHPGTIIGVMMERSVEMFAVLLSVLKNRGAYLPIDPGNPHHRINYILADSKVPMVVTTSKLTSEDKMLESLKLSGNIGVIFIDSLELPGFSSSHSFATTLSCPDPKAITSPPHLLPWVVPPATSLAYVIYTSGSTGRPKGTLVINRSVHNYLNWFKEEFEITGNDRFYFVGSFCFDMSVTSIFVPLISGAAVYIDTQGAEWDPRLYCRTVAAQRVSVIKLAPAQFRGLLDFTAGQNLASLRWIILGGEAVDGNDIKLYLDHYQHQKVVNEYGPTEATVASVFYTVSSESFNSTFTSSVDVPTGIHVPIGKPLFNTRIYILDNHLNVVPIGITGELCIGGEGVARGYLNNPELTNEKFFAKSLFYKTGDLARWLLDGNIECLGRMDQQVKVRGFRVEPGEIESQLLTYKDIEEAAVVTWQGKSRESRLCAYIVSREEISVQELRGYLTGKLPGYMIPSYIIQLKYIPLAPNGKLDRKALPKPDEFLQQQQAGYLSPETANEKQVAEVWKEVLELDRIGLDSNFFELGGHSLDIIKLNVKLQQLYRRDIPVVMMFRFPTVRTLAQYLDEEGIGGTFAERKKEFLDVIGEGKGNLEPMIQKIKEEIKPSAKDEITVGTGLEIAVIGMSGRFPGAENIDEFWNKLKNGMESISFFTDQDLEDAGLNPKVFKKPAYVKAKGVLKGVEFFDASFFGYLPGEAELMDPQMRIFNECVWEALEDAGYEPGSYKGRIGLYAGASNGFPWQGLIFVSGMGKNLASYSVSHLKDKDYLSTYISYKLDLKGPSFSIQTACSTSLTVIHLGIRALIDGECEMVLAGGVSVMLPQWQGHMYQEGMIMSPDGHCRTFGHQAKGTVAGEGAGVVLLKSLGDAAADNDHIYAVIKGSAVNNDGKNKVGFTAPSIEGQAKVIKRAQLIAGVKPESISYIEAHGTGTLLGDPIEIEALKLAFNTKGKGFCGIGSVKSNIGHLDSAAGVAGFIKTVLAIKHRQIPPSLHFESSNPKIDFDNSPFFVVTRLTPWKNNGSPLRAGVSSFGIGGTNVHVVLEEWPANNRSANRYIGESAGSLYQLIPLSAKSETALDKMSRNLALYLEEHPGIHLADAAYTLQLGRKSFEYRRMAVCTDVNEAVQLLSSPDYTGIRVLQTKNEVLPIVFMFPGQGAQYVNMGLELYREVPLFRQEMDRCFDILKPILDFDIREILYPGNSTAQVSELKHETDTQAGGEAQKTEEDAVQPGTINQTEVAQPILFIFEYALAKLLMYWGIQPKAMIGHSIGEYTAACLAGVFSLEDAIKLVVLRGKLMQQMPIGAMLSVALSEDELKPLLAQNPQLAIAAVNTPQTCAVSGTHQAIENFEGQLKENGIQCRRLHTSHAFHSSMMDPILNRFRQEVGQVPLSKPGIPYISNLTGKWATVEEVSERGYWSAHLRNPVRFQEGIGELVKAKQSMFVEVGPGKTLSTFARQHPQRKIEHMIVNLLRHPREKEPDLFYLLNKIGALWCSGGKIDWNRFHPGQTRYRLPLPTYPFEGDYFPIDRNAFKLGTEKLSTGADYKKKRIADWFYMPVWKQTLLKLHQKTLKPVKSSWLIFADNLGLGRQLVKRLEKEGHEIIIVRTGQAFSRLNRREYSINPHNRREYTVLLKEILSAGSIPGKVVHLWGVDKKNNHEWNRKSIEKDMDVYYYSLLRLTRAIQKNYSGNIQITIITDNMQEVTGEEVLRPEKAAILGLAKVIPQEYSNIRCRSIDIMSPPRKKWQKEELLTQLVTELHSEINDTVIAYRGNHRWIQMYEPLPLDRPKENVSLLRQQGVYLITGGFGEIGMILAQHLVKSVQARVILTGRSDFPPRQEWEEWLSPVNEKERKPILQKIKKLKELEKLGGKIMVLSANASNETQMRDAVNRAEKQFGPIHGVIHAAGVTRGKSFPCTVEQTSGTKCEIQFEPKVYGTMVLERIFQDRNLDFCMFMSSLSAVLGGLGFAAYSTANLWMDYLIKKCSRQKSTPWFTVDWDGWKFKQSDSSRTEANPAKLDMKPQEGLEAFQRILSQPGLRHIVVSTGNLSARIDKWIKLASLQENKDYNKNKAVNLHTRPKLSTAYVPPRNHLEKTLAEIWEKFFGIHPVGIRDDFFELGGDSLKLMACASQIHKQLKVNIPLEKFFETPIIEEMAGYINLAEKSDYLYIKEEEKKEYYSLSFAQKRLFLLQQLNPESTAYNEYTIIMLEGHLEKTKLEKTFKKLIKRHEILRTSHEMIEEIPLQRVHEYESVNFAIEYYDLVSPRKGMTIQEDKKDAIEPSLSIIETSGQRNQSLDARIEKTINQFIRPFDLSCAPLMRVGVIKKEENKNILAIDMHHIIVDGISNHILIKDFRALYKGKQLPPLRIQYKDFSEWQNHCFLSGIMKTQEEYWLSRFSGEIPQLDFSHFPGFSREKDKTDGTEGAASVESRISSEVTGALKQMLSETETTLHIVLVAVYYILLSKYTGQEDIVIGSTSAGRNHADLVEIMGMFVNMLAMRNYPLPDKTFGKFLEEVRVNALNSYENQDYPFDQLVKQLGIPRLPDRNPLFDAVIHFQNIDIAKIGPRTSKKGVNISVKAAPYRFKFRQDKFSLVLAATAGNETIKLKLTYSTALMGRASAKRMLEHYIEILKQVINNQDIALKDINIFHKVRKLKSTFFQDEQGEFQF